MKRYTERKKYIETEKNRNETRKIQAKPERCGNPIEGIIHRNR